MVLLSKVLKSIFALVLVAVIPTLLLGGCGEKIVQTWVTNKQKAEANLLFVQGLEQYRASNYSAALQLWEQALKIYQEIGDRDGEAVSFLNLGSIYGAQGEYEKAINFYQQSLAIQQEIGDRNGEARSFMGLGNTRNLQGEYEKGINFYQQSLTIQQEIGDRYGEENSLHNLGQIYGSLGKYHKAIELVQQALAIQQEIGDRYGEVQSLNSLGATHFILGKNERAIHFYQRSLRISKKIGDRNGEADSLGGLGNIHNLRGEYQKAVDFYQQSLTITQEIGARLGEATSLNNLGVSYFLLEKHQKAIDFYQKSLVIVQEIGDREGEARSLKNIGSLLNKQNQPELAIIFYKQSIDTIETIRQDIRGLSLELQQSYTETIADTYRTLADLLIEQDRILEAQRVLDLLKVQELEEYLRGVRGNENTATGLDTLAPEREFWERYGARLDELVRLGTELQTLRQTPYDSLTAPQQERRTQLETRQRQITAEFNTFLDSPEIVAIVGKLSRITGGETLHPRLLRTLQDNLQQLDSNAVVLYPLILEDRLELILATPNSPPIRRTVHIKRTDLNRVITDFRQALTDKTSDPKPLARQLYQYLIAPLQPAFEEANIETIIYAPDAQLRYIPLAALHDGENWLVETYRINNITALSLTDLDKSDRPLSVLAGAFTQGRYSFEIDGKPYDFTGLQFAGKEVETLANLIPNTVKLLDQNFNAAAVLRRMSDPSILHLATHAAFVIGRPEDSFILFGSGERATFRDVQNWNLPNTDLVVLSACETGLGGQIAMADGREILGFGYLMQEAGARAALASLWSVNDNSTQVLMNALYANVRDRKTKAEALRLAQIAMISEVGVTGENERGVVRLEDPVTGEAAKIDRSRLGHPYYWASFILIGNGL